MHVYLDTSVDNLFFSIKEQSERLKEMAIIEERNSIAGQMHDTVGHTLTAAILTLELAEDLLSKQIDTSAQTIIKQLKEIAIVEEYDRIGGLSYDAVGHTLNAAISTLEMTKELLLKQADEATQKLIQGKQLVKRGISELRDSVRAVREENKVEFVVAFYKLLNDIYLDTGFDVRSIISSKVHLLPLQTGILLSATKECVTNAIKHGKATQADILIQEYNEQLQFTFTDNGVGSSDIKLGSGLSIMRERIQSVGGRIEVESSYGEGFTVSLIIPIVQIETQFNKLRNIELGI